jgi:hypothetical protein
MMAPGASDRFETSLDQFRPGLGQHLDRHIVRDQTLLDQLTDKNEIRLRRSRKADLNFLETELHQQIKHPPFAIRSHRLYERLIAVAQIHAAPQRRTVNDARGPASVWQINCRKRAVFMNRHAGHRNLLKRLGPPPNGVAS